MTWQTRPKSLRSRSTIIRFSAWSFSDLARARAEVRSWPASWKRGAVPLMGLASRVPPLPPYTTNLSSVSVSGKTGVWCGHQSQSG